MHPGSGDGFLKELRWCAACGLVVTGIHIGGEIARLFIPEEVKPKNETAYLFFRMPEEKFGHPHQEEKSAEIHKHGAAVMSSGGTLFFNTENL